MRAANIQFWEAVFESQRVRMKQVISISRRTDIPAHYLDWLIERVNEGTVDVVNPFNPAQKRTVSLRSEDVHTLVFWSKDYGRLLREMRRFEKYSNLLFHFTINDCPYLEPRIPPLEQRLTQAETLVKMFGAERLAWRFDPLVFWDGGKLYIMDRASEAPRELLSLEPGRVYDQFHVSRDERWIFIARQDEESNLWLMTLD